MNHLLSTAVVFCTVAFPLAHGQMMGQMVTAEWRYPDINTTYESHLVTVAPGVELFAGSILGGGNFDLDIGDDWVEFQFLGTASFSSATFNGWMFRDTTDSLPPITGYEIDYASPGMGNVLNFSTGFTENEFWSNTTGLTSAGAGEVLRFRVTFNAGTAFCFGDMSDTVCNCGNISATGEGCANSTTRGAILASFGSGTAATDDFLLLGSQLPPSVPMLFFAGTDSLTPAPLLGDGLLCATGIITRIEVLMSDAQGRGLSSVSIAAALGAQAGTRHVFQIWYRDVQGPCSTGFNTSGAIDLTWN